MRGAAKMDEPTIRLRASELENSGDVGNNPTDNLTMGEVIATRFSRRDLLRGSLAVTAISAALGGRALAADEQPATAAPVPSFDFPEIEAGVDHTHHVAEGYDTQVLIRWGAPLFPGAPIRLQYRLPRLHPDQRVERPRSPCGEPRVHQ